MSAPDRIWATYNAKALVTNMPRFHGDAEYIRADLVPKWMPIETAPMDGTWVMGYFPNLGVAQMIWYNDRSGLVDHWMRFGKLTFMDPTHWQPLPTQPPAT